MQPKNRRRKKRKLETKKRYEWLVSLILFIWTLIAMTVWNVDPEILRNVGIKGSYLPMGVLLWLGLFLFLSLLFLSSRRAIFWTSGIIVYLYFRLWRIGNMINGLLLLGTLLSIEIYLWQKKRGAKDK